MTFGEIAPGISPYITPHALERLQEHYSNKIGIRGALTVLRSSLEVQSGVVAGLLGRTMEAVQDRYFLPREKKGLFVIVDRDTHVQSGYVVVTYIRFGSQQQTAAAKLWP
jgi:hypothetical protein